MISKKIIVTGISIFLLALFVFIGSLALVKIIPELLGENDNDSQERKVTITYWGLFDPNEVMQPLIDKYESEHFNVTIEYSKRELENNIPRYKESLYTRLKQGNGPTIFRAHSAWMPLLFTEIAPNQQMGIEEFRNTFYPVATDQCTTSDGQIICIPLMYDGLSILYNKDAFERAAIREPRTWEELRDVAQKLTKTDSNGKGPMSGIAMGTGYNISNSPDILALMFAQSNVAIPDALDTEAAKAAVEFYASFATRNIWSNKMPYSTEAFATEKVAMMFGRVTDINNILKINPTLRIGVMPVPQVLSFTEGTTQVTWATFWVESVSNDATPEQQAAAWEFINWLSEADQQVALFSNTKDLTHIGRVPSNKTIAESFRSVTYIGSYIDQAPLAQTEVVSDHAGNYPYEEAFKDLLEKSSTGGDPTGYLKEVKSEWGKVIK